MSNLTEGAGKESFRVKEVVTPHKLSVLIMINEYCAMKTKTTNTSRPTIFGEIIENTNKLTHKEMRNFMISTLRLLQSSDVELKEFLTTQKDILNPQLFDTLKQRLQEIYEGGIEPLADFFEPLSKLLSGDPQPVITKTSVLGLFIRRMVVAYDSLSFSKLIQFYDKFRTYYEKYLPLDCSNGSIGNELSESMTELYAISHADLRNSDTNRSNDEKAESTSGNNTMRAGFYSQKQAEYFIIMQGFRMQYNENEALPPRELQEKITDMLRVNPELAEAHFLSYLNSLRVKEFCTALHNLYHYFDRHTPTSSDAGQASRAKDEDVNRRFAALNLASLHYRFGHRREALAALDEAVRMAQESNDHVCLQHALGWLYRLGETGTEETRNLLERSVVKTQEHDLPYLASLGVQAFARHNALATSIPSGIFEFIVKSDVLNCQYSQSGFMCVSCVHKAALWQMYGKRESCVMYNQLAMNLETSDCGLYYNGELSCIALCNLAKLHVDKGDYSCATELLAYAKQLFPPHTRHAHIWMACEQEMNFTRAMYCGDWTAAQQAVLNLKAVNPIEADIRDAALKKDCGETTSASLICEDLLRQCKENSEIMPQFKCRVQLLLSQLYCETGKHTSAIVPLLECIRIARSHHLSYTLSMASCYMAFVQLSTSLASQAVDLLDAHMPNILTNGILYDHARVMSLCTKCRLAASIDSSPKERDSALRWAADTMNDVIATFRSLDAVIQLKNCLYYQTLVYQQLGRTSDRNAAAHQFKKLDQQLPNLSPVTANFF